MTSRAARPSVASALDDPPQHVEVDRRVADHAAVDRLPTGLELRLHEWDDRAAAGTEAGGHRPENEPERDERDVDDRDRDRLGQDARSQGPSVHPLHRDDPRIPPERLCQLTAADVDRVDPARAALEEDVREAARRCARVECYPPGRIDPEGVDGRHQLVPAPRDVRFRDASPPRASPGSRRSPALRSRRAASPDPDPDAAGHDQGLGPGPALGQASLHEEQVESLARGPGRWHHPPIVAQAAPRRRTRRPRSQHQPADDAASRSGRAWSAASASRTWASIPSTSRRMSRRRSATEP